MSAWGNCPSRLADPCGCERFPEEIWHPLLWSPSVRRPNFSVGDLGMLGKRIEPFSHIPYHPSRHSQLKWQRMASMDTVSSRSVKWWGSWTVEGLVYQLPQRSSIRKGKCTSSFLASPLGEMMFTGQKLSGQPWMSATILTSTTRTASTTLITGTRAATLIT